LSATLDVAWIHLKKPKRFSLSHARSQQKEKAGRKYTMKRILLKSEKTKAEAIHKEICLHCFGLNLNEQPKKRRKKGKRRMVEKQG
jgi:hypothetical protein